jgi:hypothetical protein
MAKSAYDSRNVFNISDPHLYRCQVLHYSSRLSRLYLSVMKEGSTAPVFYLLFSDVGYMDCPMNWQGADFAIGTQDECIQLMLDTGLVGQAILRFPNAYATLTEYARLYRVQTPTYTVRLIASAANMVQTVPEF